MQRPDLDKTFNGRCLDILVTSFHTRPILRNEFAETHRVVHLTPLDAKCSLVVDSMNTSASAPRLPVPGLQAGCDHWPLQCIQRASRKPVKDSLPCNNFIYALGIQQSAPIAPRQANAMRSRQDAPCATLCGRRVVGVGAPSRRVTATIIPQGRCYHDAIKNMGHCQSTSFDQRVQVKVRSR